MPSHFNASSSNAKSLSPVSNWQQKCTKSTHPSMQQSQLTPPPTRFVILSSLVDQLSTSINTLAALLVPLRLLLSTKNKIHVVDPQEEVLNHQVKKSLTTSLLLSYFDIIRPTQLCTDTSRQGLGFILHQNMAKNGL